MRYKTIVLELLQDQYPALHERLRQERTLLQTLTDYAVTLKRHHETWMDRLSTKRPDSDPILTASEALELALLDLRDDLPCESPLDEMDTPNRLDEAMAYLRRATPSA